MDKQTLSNYGWLVIVTLILAVMLALATPFGTYVGDAVVSVANGFVGASDAAIDEDNIATNEDKWDSKFDYSGFNKVDISKASSTLEENDWATISAVVKAGKAEEMGWKVGDTKTLTIGEYKWDSAIDDYKITLVTKTATIIGLNHDGDNTATFMITSDGGVGKHHMSNDTNEGGWEASYMRESLKTDIYNSMTDVKDYIKPVTKLTNNVGYQSTVVTETIDTIFLLSPKEAGVTNKLDTDFSCSDEYKAALEKEGMVYDWFKTNIIDDYHYLRSPNANSEEYFLCYESGTLNYGRRCDIDVYIYPAFVIG